MTADEAPAPDGAVRPAGVRSLRRAHHLRLDGLVVTIRPIGGGDVGCGMRRPGSR